MVNIGYNKGRHKVGEIQHPCHVGNTTMLGDRLVTQDVDGMSSNTDADNKLLDSVNLHPHPSDTCKA